MLRTVGIITHTLPHRLTILICGNLSVENNRSGISHASSSTGCQNSSVSAQNQPPFVRRFAFYIVAWWWSFATICFIPFTAGSMNETSDSGSTHFLVLVRSCRNRELLIIGDAEAAAEMDNL